MIKFLIRLFIAVGILAVVFIAGLFSSSLGIFSFLGEPRANITVTTVLESVQALSQLTTTRYNFSNVISSERDLPPLLEGLYGDQLVMVAIGHVNAGIDLSTLTDDDIQIVGDTLTITLPPPTLQDCFFNEQDSYVIERNTGFFASPVPNLDAQSRLFALQNFRDEALDGGILEEAAQQAQNAVMEFAQVLAGDAYTTINIISTPPVADAPLPDTCTDPNAGGRGIVTKTAFVFPGQGSQHVGMAADFAEHYPAARQVFEEANDLLGIAFSDLMFNGPAETLDDTLNTQPALYIASIAILRALQTEHPELNPVCTAGHSLGEYTALTAAGSLAFADGLRLVRERARLMQAAGQDHPGGMAALLGLEVAAVEQVCREASTQTGGALVVANDNCPGQTVISGDNAILDVGLALAAAAGAKRAIRLAVSVAAHSPLMIPAAAALRPLIDATTFAVPSVPVYANGSAAPLCDAERIRQELHQQLVQPVRWTATVKAMIAAGVETFIEIGSKDVLTTLLKRIDRGRNGIALNSVETLRSLTPS